MAGRPIEIPIIVNADGAESGVSKVSDSFDDLEKDLKDTGKAGEKAFEQLEDSSKDASDSIKDDAKEAANAIDRDLTKALKDVEDKADSTGKGIGKSLKDGTDKASGGMKDLKEEANSTAKESAASFDGSAESIGDTFQELAANVFAGFGPAGAAAGLAAAVGIGIAISKMQEMAETNNEAKEKMADLAREIYEAGGALDDAAIAEKITDIAFALASEDNPWTVWSNEAKTGVETVREALEGVADVSAKDVFKGLGGDIESGQKAFDQLTDSINRDKEALKEHQAVTLDGGPAYDEEGRKILESIDKREQLRKKIEESSGASKDATSDAKFYADAMGDSADAVQNRKDKEEELLQVQQERFDAEEKLAGVNRDAISNEIEYNQLLAETTTEIANRGKATDTLTKAGQENNTALIDLSETGANYLQGLYDQGAGADVLAGKVASVREQFIAQAVAAGYNKEEAEALAVSYGLIPPEVSTKVSQTGAEETKAAVDAVPEEKATEVKVTESGTAETQGAIDGVAGKDVAVEVTDDGTSGQVQKRVDDLKGKDIKIDVQDFRTVEQTQNRINDIKGRDVDITVKLANLQAIQNELALLTVPRTAYVDIVQRKGQEAP